MKPFSHCDYIGKFHLQLKSIGSIPRLCGIALLDVGDCSNIHRCFYSDLLVVKHSSVVGCVMHMQGFNSSQKSQVTAFPNLKDGEL